MGFLRFILALTVVVGHTTHLLQFNYMDPTTAVEVFFTISGFYMAMVLEEKYTSEKLGQGHITKFYISRYTRLYPAYFVCLILTMLYLYCSGDDFNSVDYGDVDPLLIWGKVLELSHSVKNFIFQSYFFVTNLFIFFQDLVLNISINEGQAAFSLHRAISGDFYIGSGLIIPQAWSLGIELSFYVLAPFLLKLKNPYLISSFLLFFGMKLAMIFFGKPSDLYYRSFPYVFCYFLLGALVYRYASILNGFKGRQRMVIYVFFSYLFIVLMVWVFPPVGLGVYSIAIVALIAVALPSIFHVTKSFKLDRLIGELSYPIYVFHIFFKMVAVNNWQKFGDLAVYLNIDHVKLIALLTISWTILASLIFSLFESYYITPWRHRLFEQPDYKLTPKMMLDPQVAT